MALWLTNFPELLQMSTIFVLILEFVSPFFFVFPFETKNFKMIGMALIFLLHISIFLTLRVGNFVWISFSVPLCFLPDYFWDFLQRRFDRNVHERHKILFCETTFSFQILTFFKYFFLFDSSLKFEKINQQKLSEKYWLICISNNGKEFSNCDAWKKIIFCSPFFFLFLPILTISYFQQKINQIEVKKINNNNSLPHKFSLQKKTENEEKKKILKNYKNWKKIKTKVKNILLVLTITSVVLWNLEDNKYLEKKISHQKF